MPFARNYFWVPVEKTEINVRIKTTKTLSTVTKRTRLPLVLAWTCKVHKIEA